MQYTEIKIGKNEANQRCDRLLKKYLKNSSSGNIYRLLRKKLVRVNGRKARENFVLREGDILQFRIGKDVLNELVGERTAVPAMEGFQLDIVYEDTNILLVNKPYGIISHPDLNRRFSLVDAVKRYLLDKGEYNPSREKTFSPASVNRLDLNTSGLVIFAKNNRSLQILNEKIRERKISKYYLALVKGSLSESSELSGYLEKDTKQNRARISQLPSSKAEKYKKVIMRYKNIESTSDFTLLKVELVTGAPHQIRAQLFSKGFPIAGDPKYGNKKWNYELKNTLGLTRQFLHAYSVAFYDCTGVLEYLNGKSFACSLPGDLQAVLDRLGLYNVSYSN